MAQNTMVWLLSKGLNDIATSGETPKFDIKWSLPIYDHLTDGTVMTTPASNPGPDMDDGTTPPSHNQSAPGDFNGGLLVKGSHYSLTQWPENGGYVPVTETSGWAKNPEWSMISEVPQVGNTIVVGQNGNTSFKLGSVSGGSFVEGGTQPTQLPLSAWSEDLLYKNVRYDGTSTEDPEEGQDPLAYAHYTVYLRCQSNFDASSFIWGDIRFNKVLLFTDIGGEPVPIAMVCLATPVALFANNQGQSNSLAISFQLGFNPNDTNVESVTFDNLYWTKVGEYPDHEGDMRLFSRNKLVLGEVGEDSENPAFVEINDPSNTSIIQYNAIQNATTYTSEYTKDSVCNISLASPAQLVSKYVSGSIASISLLGGVESAPWSVNLNDSLVLLNMGNINVSTFPPEIFANQSIVVGMGRNNARFFDSVSVGGIFTNRVKKNYNEGEPIWISGHLVGSLTVGSEINLAFPYQQPTTGTLGSPKPGDVSVIVGQSNMVWSGFANDISQVASSRTVIIGRNNQVDNSWSPAWQEGGSPATSVSEGEVADSYVLGSLNAIGNTAEKNTSGFNTANTINYVLGIGNIIPQNLRGGNFPSTTTTKRYILGSNNQIKLGDTATVTPDIYIFGSNNTVSIDARSNYYGNNKYVFGSGIAVESWEEFVVGHCSSGLHNENSAHYNNGAIRLMRMGITQGENTGGVEQPGCWSLSVVFGGPFGYKDRVYGWDYENNLMLPHKSQVLAYPDKFKSGTLCIDNNSQDGDGKFWNVCYYYPTSNP